MKKIDINKTITFLLLLISIGGGVGLATYFFLNRKINNGNDGNVLIIGEPILYPELSQKLPNHDLVIKQYPYAKNSNGDLLYFYNNNEMEQLIGRVDEIIYGPEIFGLKEISINNYELLGDDSNGVYYPSIGIMSLKADYGNINRQMDANRPDMSIENTFEIFYHEYGHHLFYSYVTSPFPISTVESRELYNAGYVDKDFATWFETAFKYNSKNVKEPKNFLGQSDNFTSIASEISLYDIYNNANRHEKIISDDKLIYWYPSDKFNKNVGGFFLQAYISSLPYLYSFDELLTRKWMQATMPFTDTAKASIYPTTYNSYTYNNSPFVSLNAFYEDFVRYGSLYYSNVTNLNVWNAELETISPNYVSNNFDVSYYYDDNPFLLSPLNNQITIAQEMAQKMATQMGAQNTREVSWILPKNSNYYYYDGENVSASWDDKWTYNEGNNLKIGGYLNSTLANTLNNDNSYLAVKNDDDLFESITSISLVKKPVTYKETIFNDEVIPVENASEWFWVTDNYFDATQFANKELYLICKDSEQKTSFNHKLISYRGQLGATDEGIVSSWYEHFPLRSGNSMNLWSAKLSSSTQPGVVLNSEGKFDFFR